MSYIFKYFDDFISQESFDGVPISPKKMEMYEQEKIRRRGTEVVDYLRDKYYSDQEEGLFILFRRLFKRLLFLIKASVEIIGDQQEELVLYWQQHSVHFKEYYATVKINEELSIILDLFLNEFDLKGVEGFDFDENDTSYKLRPFQHREAVFNHYNLELVNSLRNNQEISCEFKNVFPLLAKKIEVIYEHKDIIIGIFENPHDNTFCAISEERLLQPFFDLDILEGEESKQIYQDAISFIRRQVSLFMVQEEKEKFIISFYLHTGCCKEVIVDYVSNSLNKISCATSQNRTDKINEFIEWYDLEVKFPKYGDYHDRFYKSRSNEIKNEVESFLNSYRTGLIQEQTTDNTEVIAINEQLQFSENAESLSLMFGLMCTVGLFDEDNNSKIGRVLSNSFLTKKKSKKLTPRTLADYINPDKREYDYKNVPYLKGKLQKMISELNNIKIKKKLN